MLANAHALAADQAIGQLGGDAARGLSAAEAAARLARHGPNELPAPPPEPRWKRFLRQFRSGLVLLLVGACAISFGVWAFEGAAEPPYEALAILAIILVNAVIGYLQEERAERAVSALKRMTAARALVVRDGEKRSIPASEVVPGDLLAIEEGARIPADARLLQAVSLHAAEAPLTGESTPVHKRTEPLAAGTALADRSNMVFAGTAASSGHGLAVVAATGRDTELGRIAGMIAGMQSPPTPLQRQLDRLGKLLGVAVILIALVVAAATLTMAPERTAHALLGVLLFAIALAVAAVPEGLPAMLTVVLSLGTQRMARRNAIVRTLAAVETLGSATVICSDKTGTLTRDEMAVRRLLADDRTLALACGALCNNATLATGDPTERALKKGAADAGLDPLQLEARYPRLAEVPFSSERKLMSTLHADGEARVLMAKGAPDVLLARCSRERAGGADVPLGDARRAAILAGVEGLAGEALRTLGLATRRLPPAAGLAPEAERDLSWLGVVGLRDPPRPEAAAAVRTAQAAGVRVVMITGDHPGTALAIARELGIAAADGRAVTGAEIDRLSAAGLEALAAGANVYARVSPEHKLAIVRALHARGEIVAMTGDGVNDAPALKAADIGIAMGITGTDVAREAADIVLADDNFASIVAAIEEGRAIYANIQSFLRYLLAANLGEVLALFLGVMLAGALGLAAAGGGELVLPLLAAQILWVNLVTDAAPALALGVDPAESDLMRRAPRDPREHVITPRMWRTTALVAFVIGAGTLCTLGWGLEHGSSVDYARTLAFTTLVLYELFDVFCARSDVESAARAVWRNAWIWAAAAAGLVLQLAVVYAPPLQRAFGTVALGAADWLLCAAVAATVVLAREARKAWCRAADQRARMAAP
jgi:Ca2+-transporting ATPase